MKEKKLPALIFGALGFWLIALPLTFGYAGHLAQKSDLISGILLIIFCFFSLKSYSWSGWAAGLVGVWLQLAPLVFWAPSALMYVNDTLIGSIAIVLSFFLNKKRGNQSDRDPRGVVVQSFRLVPPHSDSCFSNSVLVFC